jgi:glucose-1-phosphate thymidylyltransferase
MKGIILHGGHGTRLRPLTHTGPKQLLPIANKPMSEYALEDLKNAGIKEIAIIIGDVYPEKVKEYYQNGDNYEVKISYIYQDKPKGIAHAIRLCKEFIGNDKFVVYLGDNILRKNITSYREKFESQNSDAMILLCEVKNPEQFGVAELNENKDQIKKIIEKPKKPASNLAVIGIYFLTPKIFDIIDRLKPSGRGELEITEAMQLLIDEKNKVTFDTVTGWWKDTGTPEDIIHANKLVLDSIGTKDQFLINSDVKIKNKIIIGKNSSISPDLIINGPVIIGDNCRLDSSVNIGPYVSIGNNCSLKKCNIKNSILMNDCKIDKEINIFDSIIANGSEIEDMGEERKCQFLLGERSHLKL